MPSSDGVQELSSSSDESEEEVVHIDDSSPEPEVIKACMFCGRSDVDDGEMVGKMCQATAVKYRKPGSYGKRRRGKRDVEKLLVHELCLVSNALLNRQVSEHLFRLFLPYFLD